jgi:hypothetical protein
MQRVQFFCSPPSANKKPQRSGARRSLTFRLPFAEGGAQKIKMKRNMMPALDEFVIN